MKNLIKFVLGPIVIIGVLALAGCNDRDPVDSFKRGDRVKALVSKETTGDMDSNSSCILHVYVRSTNLGGDLSLRVKLITDTCKDQ